MIEQCHFFLCFIPQTVQVKEKPPCPFELQNSNLEKMKQGKGKFVDSKYVKLVTKGLSGVNPKLGNTESYL